MRRRIAVSLGLVLCLVFCTRSGRSLSQTQGPKSPGEFQRWFHEQRLKEIQRQADFQQKMEEQRFESEERQKATRKIRDEYADQAWAEALGATAAQWQAIQPKLERIRQLRSTPGIEISVYAVSGAGNFQTTSSVQTSDGGRSTADASSQLSATRGVTSTSDSSTRSGTAGGSGRSFAEGGGNIRVHTPGPVKKQVGDVNLGWQWRRPSLNEDADKLTEGDRACEQLLDALEAKNPDAEHVRQRVEALRQVRAQRQVELREAQRQLREVITPEQEPKLILMGYLD
jgi:hypothetical protein